MSDRSDDPMRGRLAVFSRCKRYRYALHRDCSIAGAGRCLFVMLNPSTADEIKNDPTVRRCIGYATRWGFRGLYVANIFALRSTDPSVLYASTDPVGSHNDTWIVDLAKSSDRVVCAWGAHGALQGRGARVLELLRAAGCSPMALRVTISGQPSHPLYLPNDAEPFLLAGNGAC